MIITGSAWGRWLRRPAIRPTSRRLPTAMCRSVRSTSTSLTKRRSTPSTNVSRPRPEDAAAIGTTEVASGLLAALAALHRRGRRVVRGLRKPGFAGIARAGQGEGLTSLERPAVGDAFLIGAIVDAQLTVGRRPPAGHRVAARGEDTEPSARIEVQRVGHAVGRHLDRLTHDFRTRTPLRESGTGDGEEGQSDRGTCTKPALHDASSLSITASGLRSPLSVDCSRDDAAARNRAPHRWP